MPLALRRRVGVASLVPGSGCTTVAVELARFLSSARNDRVRFVSAQGPSPRPERGLEGTSVETLELEPTEWPADVEAWWRLHRASSDRYDLTVTDWGTSPLARIRDLAEHSHVLCLVTTAERASIQHALDIAAAIGERTRVVLVAVDVHRRAGIAAEKLVSRLPFPAVLIRHDRALGAGAARGLDGVRMLRLGARVIDAAAGISAPPVPVPAPVPAPTAMFAPVTTPVPAPGSASAPELAPAAASARHQAPTSPRVSPQAPPRVSPQAPPRVSPQAPPRVSPQAPPRVPAPPQAPTQASPQAPPHATQASPSAPPHAPAHAQVFPPAPHADRPGARP
ncbi:hypothetical protein [Pseudoclavibacter sp. VKM Ac-2867]|uniref:hypothetical protein n=1 Tax=Pseudoclavibacter sp. VKM Ac-2867 TaxID=2783829 RepID=UPI00188AA2B1|nr:hypothetical protein [Pseudoclavibacter sp. VKM Ac-2867]MBF4457733.1 hypothetical protein [Pseudoclavibacter sp. VKM Ac-2867]